MADWIKIQSDLYRHPKVILLAAILEKPDSPLCRYISHWCQCDAAVTRNVMRNATVGALVSVWGVMRHRGARCGDDLLVKELDQGVVDDIADMDGFGAAMMEVGWLEERDNGLVFPRFFADHNVDPAAANRERQRRFREKNRNASSNVTVTLGNGQRREEKSREEKNVSAIADTPLPPSLLTAEFSEAWERWQKHRKEKRQKLTPSTTALQLKVLAEYGSLRAVSAIDHSIKNGYTGIFEPDSKTVSSQGLKSLAEISRGLPRV